MLYTNIVYLVNKLLYINVLHATYVRCKLSIFNISSHFI